MLTTLNIKETWSHCFSYCRRAVLASVLGGVENTIVPARNPPVPAGNPLVPEWNPPVLAGNPPVPAGKVPRGAGRPSLVFTVYCWPIPTFIFSSCHCGRWYSHFTRVDTNTPKWDTPIKANQWYLANTYCICIILESISGARRPSVINGIHREKTNWESPAASCSSYPWWWWWWCSSWWLCPGFLLPPSSQAVAVLPWCCNNHSIIQKFHNSAFSHLLKSPLTVRKASYILLMLRPTHAVPVRRQGQGIPGQVTSIVEQLQLYQL